MTEEHQNAIKERDRQKRRANWACDRYDAISADYNDFLNKPTDDKNKIIEQHFLTAKQELLERNAALNHQSYMTQEQRDHYQREMTVARKHVRKARRIVKKTKTLVSSLTPKKPTKLQTKSIKQLISDIDQFLDDIELI